MAYIAYIDGKLNSKKRRNNGKERGKSGQTKNQLG
jgi:hypothetical protein